MNPVEYYNGVYICYSLGNFCFAGNSKPSDMSSFMFQTRWRIRDDEITNEGFRIIPIRISSRTDRNDFTPTVFGDGAARDAVLTTTASRWNMWCRNIRWSGRNKQGRLSAVC